MFSLGSPFNNQGAGRIKTSRNNEQRIEEILNNFEASPRGDAVRQRESEMTVTRTQVARNRVLFPLAGLLTGLAGSFSFVHANSLYIGKLFTLLTTVMGYKLYERSLEDYNFSRRTGMFPYYPKEIQQMLEFNDFRYGREWLTKKEKLDNTQ